MTTFITVNDGIKLTLKNVEFYKMQSGYVALIDLKAKSTLEMENVNFVRVST